MNAFLSFENIEKGLSQNNVSRLHTISIYIEHQLYRLKPVRIPIFHSPKRKFQRNPFISKRIH